MSHKASYSRPPSSDGTYRPAPPQVGSSSPGGRLARGSPRRLPFSTSAHSSSPAPAPGSDQGSLSGSVREGNSLYPTAVSGANGKFYWNRKGSLSNVSEGGSSTGNHPQPLPSPQLGPRKVPPLTAEDMLSPLLSRSTNSSQQNCLVPGSAYVLPHTPTSQQQQRAREAAEKLARESTTAPRSASESSGSVEMPHEQEAAEKPILFHRVERWLNEEAFSLEVDDFELRGGNTTNELALRRPGSAQPISSVYAATGVSDGVGTSPSYALRYRRTIESYAKQNGVHHSAQQRLFQSAVDDMGFDSMLPKATQRALSENPNGDATPARHHLRTSVPRDEAKKKEEVAELLQLDTPTKADAAAEQRRLQKAAATKRLWRSRIAGGKGNASGSDSDSYSDSSESD